MVQALDEGDELAKAWETVRDLGGQLESAKDKTHRLQVELNRERRERATEDRRWGWITTANEQFTADNHRLRVERDEALHQARDLEIRLQQATRTRPASAAPEPTPSPPSAGPALSRAERRRHEREQHRRT
jgi:chromosome segregation ATPase